MASLPVRALEENNCIPLKRTCRCPCPCAFTICPKMTKTTHRQHEHYETGEPPASVCINWTAMMLLCDSAVQSRRTLQALALVGVGHAVVGCQRHDLRQRAAALGERREERRRVAYIGHLRGSIASAASDACSAQSRAHAHSRAPGAPADRRSEAFTACRWLKCATHSKSPAKHSRVPLATVGVHPQAGGV